MDKFDIFDIDKQRTGKICSHGSELSEGQYRLVIHILIFNENEELLIQKRQDTCTKWPGKWDVTISGCSISGENGRSAAMREAKEELNLDIDLNDTRPALTVSFPSGFDEVFLLKKNIDITSLTLQQSEVAEVAWASLEEILKLIESNEFTPLFPEYISLLFRLKDSHDIFEQK